MSSDKIFALYEELAEIIQQQLRTLDEHDIDALERLTRRKQQCMEEIFRSMSRLDEQGRQRTRERVVGIVQLIVETDRELNALGSQIDRISHAQGNLERLAGIYAKPFSSQPRLEREG